MEITLFDILLIISFAQGFVFGLVLLFSPIFKGKQNKYLAYTIMIISIIGMNQWLSGWDFDEQYYFIDYFGDDVPWILLVCVPLVYYFLHSLKHPLTQNKWLPLLTVPFLIYFVLNLVINFEYDFQLYQMLGMKSFRYWVYQTESILAPIYGLFLCSASYYFIQKAEASPEDKQWLKRLWALFMILISLWLLVSIVPEGNVVVDATLYVGLWLGISFLIYWVSYKGLYQFRLAQDRTALQKLFSNQTATQKIPTSSATFTKDNSYFLELERMIEKDRIFLNSDLNREEIAQQLGISPGYLSQIINAATGNNFGHYINGYRVEEVKRMITDPTSNKYSLLAIGQQAGFKSKSAFYTSFKKMTGMTPSEFKKQLK